MTSPPARTIEVPPHVLLITRSDDPSVTPVADALVRRGAVPVRLNTDLFPAEIDLSINQGRRSTTGTLRVRERTVAIDDIAAVWYRRFAPARALPVATPLRTAAMRESHAALAGLIEMLPVFHLDDMESVRRADNKPLQLRLAAELGLSIPETLVSNDEHAVRRFAAACTDGFVAKTLSSFVVTDSDGVERAVYTSLVHDEDLQDMSGLRISPMQFQELVPKAFDVRCTVVGTRVFTAVLSAQTLGDDCVDWRVKGSELADAWEPRALPPHIEVALLALLDRLGLNYGAIDMIVTPKGDYVFLEVNPAGEFLWLDELVSPSISDVLADVLIGVGRRL